MSQSVDAGNGGKTSRVPDGYKSWADFYTKVAQESGSQPSLQSVANGAQIGAQIGQMGDGSVQTVGKATGTSAVTGTQKPSAFADWYKQNMGADYVEGAPMTKPEGMSATDWAIGQNMFYAEQTEKSLQTEYDDSLKELALSQSADEQEAYILYQNLKKYLNMANGAQGIKSPSSGDMIQASNQYQNARGEIASSYETERTKLRQGLAENRLYNSQTNAEALYELYAKKETDTETESSKDTPDPVAIGETVYSYIEQMLGEFNVVNVETGAISPADFKKLEDYYKKYEKEMDPTNRYLIQMMLEQIKVEEVQRPRVGGGGGGGVNVPVTFNTESTNKDGTGGDFSDGTSHAGGGAGGRSR